MAATAQPGSARIESERSFTIAIEATRLAREVRGIGRYVRALLPRLLSLRPHTHVILFVKARDVASMDRICREDPRLGGAVEVRAIGALRRSVADVYWFPWNVVAPAPKHGAVVVTVHDVAPLALPDPRWWKWRKNWRWRRRYRHAVERATLLVVDSQFTAAEVHRLLGVPHHRMRVALLAADDLAPPPAAGDSALLQRLGVRRPFVLSVGAADRRKNLAMIQRAIGDVVASHPDVTLVLAGPRRPKSDAVAGPPWCRTLGFVSEAELVALYRAAACLVMASDYEGFGLPVLEAMQFGTPVISVRSSSLPEVGGSAVEWVEPGDETALAEAIRRVLTDELFVARMRADGRTQAADFRWDETARTTLAAFEEARRLNG